MTPAEVQVLQENQRRAFGRTAVQRELAIVEDATPAKREVREVFVWESLELPPSANDLVRPAAMGMHRSRKGRLVPRVRLVKTKEATEWLARTQAELRVVTDGHSLPLFVGVPLRLTVRVRVPSISSDATNRVKALEDALTGIVWGDDCQVVEASVLKVLAEDSASAWLTEVRVEQVQAGPELTKRLAKSKSAQGSPTKQVQPSREADMGKRQSELPGMEAQRIEELDLAIEAYDEARNVWVSKRQDVQDAKDKLLALAAKHNVTIYRDDSHDPPLVLSIAESKVLKVKSAAAELDEDDGDEVRADA